MIVALSTSSPMASVAVLTEDGEVIHSGQTEARQRAGTACLELIAEFGINLKAVTGFVADVGPGSFTGVRVGVMLAKSLGWAHGVNVAGVTSFDLIDPSGLACVPALRGQWLVRSPGREPHTTDVLQGKGYGTLVVDPEFPHAERLKLSLHSLNWVLPMELMPAYVLEPNISVPKKPYLPGAVT